MKQRSEQEMMSLIMDFAMENEDVRAVILNGSRANSNIAKDQYQDFDIVYVMRQVRPYVEDKKWLDRFGKICVKQEPDSGVLYPDDVYEPDIHYTFLMQYEDLNRIDLSLNTLDFYLESHGRDSLTVVLLDKDQVLPKLPSSSDRDYWVSQPNAEQFRCCCNEFWWCTTYIAKGLCREELLYAMDLMNDPVRMMLHKMLGWYVGTQTDFSMSLGKSNKFIFRYLPESLRQGLIHSYPRLEIEEMWYGVEAMMDAFDEAAMYVASQLQFSYNQQESQQVRLLLKRMKNQEFVYECDI